MRKSILIGVSMIAGAFALMTVTPNTAQATGCPCKFWKTLKHFRKAPSPGGPVPVPYPNFVCSTDSAIIVGGENSNANIELMAGPDFCLASFRVVMGTAPGFNVDMVPDATNGFVAYDSQFEYPSDSSAAAACERQLQRIINVRHLDCDIDEVAH